MHVRCSTALLVSSSRLMSLVSSSMRKLAPASASNACVLRSGSSTFTVIVSLRTSLLLTFLIRGKSAQRPIASTIPVSRQVRRA
jgi:hypothetical protein